MNPPKAGERKMLPRMATYGLQIVSPAGGWPAGVAVAGIDDPGPDAVGEVTLGNGGGPAAGTGMGIAAAAAGRGGGLDVEDGIERSSADGSGGFATADFSVGSDEADAAAASGTD